MPERAAEASLISDETREELIAEAAERWAAVYGGSGAIGNLPGFLAAYYRLVAVEDLIAAGPERLPPPGAPAAGPGGGRAPGRAGRLAHRRGHRRRHHHRRHAVPGRLGDDGAEPARGRHPAH